jgi:hypothetical protein
MTEKKSQAGIEYLIVIGFVTFVVITILMMSYFYSGSIKDSMISSQIEDFAKKVISSSESVFYSGEPSRTTITCYLPDGVQDINVTGNNIVFTFYTSSGINKIAFSSNVPLVGSISSSPGLKRLKLEANQDEVNISPAS